MKKIKLFAVVLLSLMTTGAMAQTIDIASFESQTKADYFKSYSYGDDSVSISTTGSISSGNSTYYVDYSSTTGSLDANYLSICSPIATIDSIELYYGGSGNDKVISIPFAGWKTAYNIETPAATDYAEVLLSYTTPSKNGSKKSTAVWQKASFVGKGLHEVRMYRTIKAKITVNGEEKDYKNTPLGGGQTVRMYGLRVWFSPLQKTNHPFVQSFTMGDIAAAVDTAAKTITAELPYGTNREDAINNAVVKVGGTAKEYEISGNILIAKDSADASKNINYDLSGITVSTTQYFTVSYFDGSKLLGSEQVASGSKPKDFANYQTKAHCTFETWLDNNGQVVNPGDSTITSAANFYGSWTLHVTQSSSINIEQLVLSYGKKYNITNALTEANILYENLNELDSLNDDKGEGRNEPFLGLKIKKEGGYLEMGLKAGDSIKVKFGNVAADLKITINGVDSTLAKANAAKPFFYLTTEDCWVKIATTSGGTVVFKQIMINEEIKEVVLPESPTALKETMMNAKAEKFILDGKVYLRQGEKIYNALGQEILF